MIAVEGLEQLDSSKVEPGAALARIAVTLREISKRADQEGIFTAAASDAVAGARRRTGT